MQNIKAVLFDFDYTLGDSSSGIVISVNYALNKLAYPPACLLYTSPSPRD